MPTKTAIAPGQTWRRKRAGEQHRTVVIRAVEPDGTVRYRRFLHGAWVGGSDRTMTEATLRKDYRLDEGGA